MNESRNYKMEKNNNNITNEMPPKQRQETPQTTVPTTPATVVPPSSSLPPNSKTSPLPSQSAVSLLPSKPSRKRTKSNQPQFSFDQLEQYYDDLDCRNSEEAQAALDLDAMRAWTKAAEFHSSGLSWTKLSCNDSLCKKFSGFNVQEFLELVNLLQEPLKPASEINRGRPAHKVDTIEERLLLLLNWLKFGLDFGVLGAVFGISASYAHQLVCHLLEACTPVLVARFVVEITHKEQAERGYLHPNYPQAAVLVDCSDQSINTPNKKLRTKDVSTGFFSYKTNHAGYRTVSFHSCNGLVMFHKSEAASRGELTMVISEIETVCLFELILKMNDY